MVFLSYDYPLSKNLALATEKMNNTTNSVTGKTPNEMVGRNPKKRVPRKEHKGWQGGRHATKKVFKVGDVVNHLMKRVSRDKGVLYKSYERGTWSGPKKIVKKKGTKYYIEDKLSKASIEKNKNIKDPKKKKKKKGWWYTAKDLKMAHDVPEPTLKFKIPPIAPGRKLRSQKGVLWKGLD
jgi:hypothetical protein